MCQYLICERIGTSRVGSNWCQGGGKIGSLLRECVGGPGPLIRGKGNRSLGMLESRGDWMYVQEHLQGQVKSTH